MNSWVCASTPTVTERDVLNHTGRTGDLVSVFLV
jgi:hypothetical protein